MTYDRKVRKDAFFFYKANWSTEPVVHVTSCRFTERTDPVTEVKVYSNAPEVTLQVNGVSLGERTDAVGRADIHAGPASRFRRATNRVVGEGAFWRIRGSRIPASGRPGRPN